MVREYSITVGDRTITVEHGRVAKQADGAVLVRCGDSMVLVTACMSPQEMDLGFFPLTVEYREKGYAAGKIPGSIFKREGRPSDQETLSARLIDHQIRPLFPKNLKNEIQVIVSVLSHDQENDPDIIACIGASLALSISSIPFAGPYATVRVARDQEGNKIVLPTYAQLEESDADVVVAGNAESVINIEGETHELPEAALLDLMEFAHGHIKELCAFQQKIVDEIGKPKVVPVDTPLDERLVARVEELSVARICESLRIADKVAREEAQAAITKEVNAALAEEFPGQEKGIASVLEKIAKREMRNMILNEGRRIDGRTIDEVREITSEIGVLPRAHGSALFTRGQTQALASVTLGTKMDERLVDSLEGKSFKTYMLDYNFPPFATGEVKRMSGPGRREIGHGFLAERAIEPVIPASESFPYTIRIVSDILESNGSSSMATVCAASLALMDAGVPIKCAVAGVNCGLVSEGERFAILTDLLGVEDANGDMDLKIAGTEQGITAFQMDIKVGGIPMETMRLALERAREGRLHVLGLMKQAIAEPKPELSRFAPRILVVKVDPSQIGSIIGPGGKTVREIQELTGATIEIDDDGTVRVSSLDGESGQAAVRRINGIVRKPVVGEVFDGVVKSILDFGAVVEYLPGKEGLLHISEIANRRLEKVEDEIKVGDPVQVKIIEVDNQTGKVRLSHKRLLPDYDPSKERERPPRSSQSGHSHGRGR
ncbi:MAG TPA: polyribonucleotide nucleotidyltransferase [Candidatus Latescibacteria bacterium]|nr:MAG: Polyribonucleotide nucleotidyltransferase [Candidatus Latescibacteria bacterium ADurb.Bin168]HPU85748.1 polyribonucleotide nucleotidyltransferase [Candidatus Latescibacterota bacterium]